MTNSVIFQNVTKNYKMHLSNIKKIGDLILPKGFGENFYAVQNISFTAEKGDIIGVIGMNGAGKSTLSNLITGITPESSGKIIINGQASLIAISSGLNNQLTGRENIELKCLMLGFRKKEINELMPEIIEFADLGKFIDQPVKNYSSGMKSRLGFAISVNIDPDILVIDEALSVGDQSFADKSLVKMNEFKAKGKTIFFVSHSIKQVNDFCEKVIWLDAGEIKEYGPKEEVIPKYLDFVKEFKALSQEEQKRYKQQVAKKRSELRTPLESNVATTEQLQDDNRAKRTIQRKKLSRLKYGLIGFIIVVIIGLGIGYFYPSSDTTMDKPTAVETETPIIETEPVLPTQDEPEKDIRYVNVSIANIREEASLDSSISQVASFGQPLEVMETEYDEYNEIEWFKIKNITSNEEGWISSKLLISMDTNINEQNLMSNLDILLGNSNTPTFQELIDALENGELMDDSNIRVNHSNGQSGFTMDVSSLSSLDLLNELGEPTLQDQYTYLYHGTTYDYIFNLLDDGTVVDLTVMKLHD